MPSKEQYGIRWLAKHIVQNIKATKHQLPRFGSSRHQQQGKNNKASRNLRILNLSCSPGYLLEIIFCKSEVNKCHSLDTQRGHMFFWTAHMQLPRGHIHNKDWVEERWGAVHKQQNLLGLYEAGQGHDKWQDSGLPLLLVPGAGWAGNISWKDFSSFHCKPWLDIQFRTVATSCC